MNDATDDAMNRVDALAGHYERIRRERMAGLPFVNDRLSVEAVGFRAVDGDLAGVLVTPWFINLVLLPGDALSGKPGRGSTVARTIGRYSIEFTVDFAPALGPFLSAVLFRSVEGFPDQRTARAVAAEVLELTFAAPPPAGAIKTVSRRTLLGAHAGD